MSYWVTLILIWVATSILLTPLAARVFWKGNSDDND
jgi:hypothetical protein